MLKPCSILHGSGCLILFRFRHCDQFLLPALFRRVIWRFRAAPVLIQQLIGISQIVADILLLIRPKTGIKIGKLFLAFLRIRHTFPGLPKRP